MTHLWLPLALLSAFALATGDAYTKKALRDHNEYVVMWLRLLCLVPVLLGLRLVVPAPTDTSGYLRTALTALPLEIVGVLLYAKALKLSPLGLTLPFLALTPVFLLVIPVLLLRERMNAAGAGGIVLVAAGTWLVSAGDGGGLLAPFRALRRERGALCMIAVALIYSITATLGKKGIALSSPVWFASTYFPLLVAGLAPIVFLQGGAEGRRPFTLPLLRAALFPGLCSCVEIVAHVYAVSLTNVGYMIAVKRTSLLMGIAYGHFLFGESGFRRRLAGGALMVAGVFLISTAG